MRLDFAQPREPGDPRLLSLREPAAHLRDVRIEEAGELHGLLRRLADEAGCSGDSVREHVRSEPAGLRGSACAAIERRGQAALRVRERHEDLLLFATRLGDAAEGLLELVLAELELDRPDDGHRE